MTDESLQPATLRDLDYQHRQIVDLEAQVTTLREVVTMQQVNAKNTQALVEMLIGKCERLEAAVSEVALAPR